MHNRRWDAAQYIFNHLFHTLAFIVYMFNTVGALQITSLSAPGTADPRFDKPQMTCRYQFGTEGLFTVKWYKDDQEFYRYLPTYDPQIIRFPIEEVTLDENGFIETETTLEKKLATPELCNLTACTIRLVNLTANSAGEYSCEISSERPYFNIDIKSVNLTLLAPPKNPPTIHSASSTYSIGDTLSATCTSDASLPTSDISWLINGEPPPAHATVYSSDISQPDKHGLGRTISQLDLEVEEDHFQGQKNQVNLTCLATIADTNIQKSSHVLFLLPIKKEQSMDDNQKLEWNSGSGGTRAHYIHLLSLAALLARSKIL